MNFPKPRSKTERVLFLSVLLSPIFVLSHFAYRLFTNAYPPVAGSVMIPIGIYWIFPFPLFALITLKGRSGLDSPRLRLLWNPERHVVSLLWTIVSIYPVGLYVVFILLDAISGIGIPSIIYVTVLFLALLLYRAGALSRLPKQNTEQAAARQPLTRPELESASETQPL